MPDPTEPEQMDLEDRVQPAPPARSPRARGSGRATLDEAAGEGPRQARRRAKPPPPASPGRKTAQDSPASQETRATAKPAAAVKSDGAKRATADPPAAPIPTIAVPLGAKFMPWLAERARRNSRTPEDEAAALLRYLWQYDRTRMAGASAMAGEAPPPPVPVE
jgi:hypothetical protein